MKKPFLFLWILLAAVFIFSWIYLPTLSRYQDLKTREDGVEIQTKNLQAKLQDIREERDLLKNDDMYLEKVIREELGLVKPGEIVYKFVEEKPAVPVTTPVEELAQVPVAAPIISTPSPLPVQKTPALTVPAKLVSTPKEVPVKTAQALPRKTIVTTPARSASTSYPRQETR